MATASKIDLEIVEEIDNYKLKKVNIEQNNNIDSEQIAEKPHHLQKERKPDILPEDDQKHSDGDSSKSSEARKPLTVDCCHRNPSDVRKPLTVDCGHRNPSDVRKILHDRMKAKAKQKEKKDLEMKKNKSFEKEPRISSSSASSVSSSSISSQESNSVVVDARRKQREQERRQSKKRDVRN